MPLDNFEVEMAARTLLEAERIKNDPTLLNQAKAELKRQAGEAIAAADGRKVRPRQSVTTTVTNKPAVSSEQKVLWSPLRHLGRAGGNK